MADRSRETSCFNKNNEDLSSSALEDYSIFTYTNDSLVDSQPASQNTSIKKSMKSPVLQDISFSISDLSKSNENSFLNNLKISEDENTPPVKPWPKSRNMLTLMTSLKLICKPCDKIVSSIVSYEKEKENWWSHFFETLSKIKCCSEYLENKYTIVHRCRFCGNNLARISSNQNIQELSNL